MSTVTIEIPQGKLRGKQNLDFYENEYYSFEGVPYGKPPVGNLRFKPALPAEPWEGEFDATNGTPICPSYINNKVFPDLINEDCLRLNVYTPVDLTKPVDNLLPVMVYVHSSGFCRGSSHRKYIGPDFIVGKNVLLVTFNYRLGVLGFFSLNNPALNVTGNVGIKDMVEALKWVKKNISHFGGNPNNVTIFGTSSGACILNVLLLTSQTRGLFHKAIVQSGTAISPWTFNQFPVSLANKRFLEHLECISSNPKEILEFLQSKSHQELIAAEYAAFKSMERFYDFCTFQPIIEVKHESAIISESPIEILNRGDFQKCPIIIGYAQNDGSAMDAFTLTKPNTIDFSKVVLASWRLEEPEENFNRLLHQLEFSYYRNEKPSYDNKNNFYKCGTELYFAMPAVKLAKYFNMFPIYPIYLYKFSLVSKLNAKNGTANHLDDERYLFSDTATESLITRGSKEENGVNLLTTMWTNFAKTGNPNPIPSDRDVNWEPISATALNCLEIDHVPRLIVNPDGHRLNLLETMLDLENLSFHKNEYIK